MLLIVDFRFSTSEYANALALAATKAIASNLLVVVMTDNLLYILFRVCCRNRCNLADLSIQVLITEIM